LLCNSAIPQHWLRFKPCFIFANSTDTRFESLTRLNTVLIYTITHTTTHSHTLIPKHYFLIVWLLFTFKLCVCPVEAKVIQDSITKHRAVLSSILECQYGLLDELESSCVLTDQQVALIKSTRKLRYTYEKNDILLNDIAKETEGLKLNKFLSALEVTHQSHLSTYIVNNGGKIFYYE